MAQSTDRAESTTAEGRALLRDRSYHAAGLIICPRWSNVSDEDAPCECDLPYAVTHIEAAAAEAERARIRAAVLAMTAYHPHEAPYVGGDASLPCHPARCAGGMRLAVLAAIDATPDRDDLVVAEVRTHDPSKYTLHRRIVSSQFSGEIALYFHNNYCVPEFIPRGIHKPHEAIEHIPIWTFYVDYFDREGLDNLTSEEVVKAFFDVLEWDYTKDPWPGHPNPDLVIERIIENRNE